MTLAQNVPGPAAAARMRSLGASVVKVEPPAGDPLAEANPAWYEHLTTGQEVARLDLKDAAGRGRLNDYLTTADLFLTSSRPGALRRLGLSPEKLREAHPRLCVVAIVGYPAPHADEPGHDLTYLAEGGLLSPPEMPRTLLADLAGAERAVSAALTLLLDREKGNSAGYAEVALSEAAASFAEPWRFGITRPGEHLGGGFPGYSLYEAKSGWVAVAALEPHFWEKLISELGLEVATSKEDLAKVLRRETAEEWERWAAERDLPVAALRNAPDTDTTTKGRRC
ncbi:MAG: FIG00677440: hypothetical protein [uncultured Rubrobacteraceae bacterium]|uniref:Alpha-methylacyl-CoA racemase n=1 Tax=uncultured Rubrobacteraceae bacterium TaxID=349277 RepID=A0A6J4PYY0_9ACTN|nr:MAG: FIG00677440: hypothetical protein [uncultured Rubrobacteraceae bacterium]